MAGLIQSLETAKLTLINTQIQVQTANHNVANAEEPDYHRQVVDLKTLPPVRHKMMYIGTGAYVYMIRQTIDPLLENKLLYATSKQNYYEAKAEYAKILATYNFDDGNSGISAALRNFWDSWDELNESPTDAQKQNVKNAANRLVSTMKETYAMTKSLRDDIEEDIKQSIGKVNDLLEKIATYNQEIAKAETPLDSGHPDLRHTANDLRDARYSAIKELAEQLPINVEDLDNGMVRISVKVGANTITLIDGTYFGSLSYVVGSGSFEYTDIAGVPYACGDLEAGHLYGLKDIYSNATDILSAMQNIAQALTTDSNNTHTSSPVFDYTPPAPDLSNLDFAVDAGFTPDPSFAMDMAGLQDNAFYSPSDLANLQYTIGSWQRDAEDAGSFYRSLHDELLKQQQSVSGVSIDEELVNIIQYQQIFQAAARIIRTVADLLNVTVNMV